MNDFNFTMTAALLFGLNSGKFRLHNITGHSKENIILGNPFDNFSPNADFSASNASVPCNCYDVIQNTKLPSSCIFVATLDNQHIPKLWVVYFNV